MVNNSFYDLRTNNAEYLFDKILMSPERVVFNNWNNSLPQNEKCLLIYKIDNTFYKLFKYKLILSKHLPYDILKYIQLYILNMSLKSFKKFKYFKLDLINSVGNKTYQKYIKNLNDEKK